MNVKSKQNVGIQKIRKKKFALLFGMTYITVLFWAIRKTVFNDGNIKSLNMITEEMYEIEIPVIIEKSLAKWTNMESQ